MQRKEAGLLAILLYTLVQNVLGSNITMSTILEDIFQNYDKKLPPKNDLPIEDRQVLVTVNVFINAMYSISESNMDYQMSMFLRERWIDDRLSFNDTLNLTRLELATSLHDNIWLPDMYILNEKSSDFHEVTVPNRLIHVYPDGTIQLSMRVTGIFTCLMNLQKYPFDHQACKFEVESYGHSTENLKFVWSPDAVSLADHIEFPQFTLVETKPYSCEKNYYGIIYPCIGIKFVLERNNAYYILQIYLPSILIVVLSWVNFWLDCTSVPARISLGLLTVLTMTTQSSGARANLPRVSYVKAIDIYMAVCLAFVFLGLVEFAYVNVLSRIETKGSDSPVTRIEKEPTDVSDISNGKPEGFRKNRKNSTNISVASRSKFLWRRSLRGNDRARFVDKASRVIFPVTFTVFNIVYWTFYFTWKPAYMKDILS